MAEQQPWCETCEIYPVNEFLLGVEHELPQSVIASINTARELMKREPCPRVLDLRDTPEHPAHCDYEHEPEIKVAFRGALHILAIQRNDGNEPPNIAPLVAAARAN